MEDRRQFKVEVSEATMREINVMKAELDATSEEFLGIMLDLYRRANNERGYQVDVVWPRDAGGTAAGFTKVFEPTMMNDEFYVTGDLSRQLMVREGVIVERSPCRVEVCDIARTHGLDVPPWVIASR